MKNEWLLYDVEETDKWVVNIRRLQAKTRQNE